jgi:hypothetical protein
VVLSHSETLEKMSFTVQVPDVPGHLDFTSPFDASLHQTITAYGPPDVTSLIAVPVDSRPITVLAPRTLAVRTSPRIANIVTCGGDVAFTARTETPDVCAGPGGETEWAASTSLFLEYQVLKEGACRLSLSVDGSTSVTTYGESIFFVRAPNLDISTSVEGACTQAGRVACESKSSSLVTCVNGAWKTRGACPRGQVCDYVAAGSGPCAGPDDCAGCRGLQ